MVIPAILGIDLDTTRVHMVLIDGKMDTDEIVAQSVVPKSWVASRKFLPLMGSVEVSLQHMRVQMSKARPEDRAVYIEGLPWIKNRAGFASLAKVLGGVQLLVHQTMGLEAKVLNGAEWKHELGLSGNANKEAIAAWVRGYRGEEFETQDLNDAFCVALAGYSLSIVEEEPA